MRITRLLLPIGLVAAFAACADDEESPSLDPAPAPSGEQPVGPAVPDGGVPEGHGAEDEAPPPRERGSIIVPETDRTPPQPIVRLAGAQATLDRSAPKVLVPRDAPMTVTVVGRDSDGGMGRARVAIRARLTCLGATGRVATEPFVRYVPPPQIVRIRIAPGTRTRTELSRTVTQRFGAAQCKGRTLERFSGQAWADTTNASGLDATSRHIHFASR
ncbi:MAG: hypothetical protein ACRDL0_17665 [Thermoleophilaceae bacterium]